MKRSRFTEEQIMELGFTAFVKGAEPGHLFITLSSGGDVSCPLQEGQE
jgi:hypothetical protein